MMSCTDRTCSTKASDEKFADDCRTRYDLEGYELS